MLSKRKAYLLLIFTGGIGGHWFYLGNYKKALLYLFTGGLFGLGTIYDLFTLSKQVDLYNYGELDIPAPLSKEFY